MKNVFADFDLTNFWEESESASISYVAAPPTDELILSVENELGYKLPASYIELMKHQNGGPPKKWCVPAKGKTSWADDHVTLTGIMGIGREKTY